MTKIISTGPPTFAEHNKFNGMHWNAWKESILMVIKSKGLEGYLNSSITNPLQNQHSLITTTAKSPASPSIIPLPISLQITPAIPETLWNWPNLTSKE